MISLKKYDLSFQEEVLWHQIANRVHQSLQVGVWYQEELLQIRKELEKEESKKES